jgi:ABC-2 type transport system ATP-binding protein
VIEHLSAKELDSRCRDALSIQVADVEKACVVLEDICGCRDYRILPHKTILCYDRIDRPEQINRQLAENGVDVYALVRKGKDLEDYFIGLLGGRTDA